MTKKKFFCPLSQGKGGGIKALVDCPLKNELFFYLRLPLEYYDIIRQKRRNVIRFYIQGD